MSDAWRASVRVDRCSSSYMLSSNEKTRSHEAEPRGHVTCEPRLT